MLKFRMWLFKSKFFKDIRYRYYKEAYDQGYFDCEMDKEYGDNFNKNWSDKK